MKRSFLICLFFLSFITLRVIHIRANPPSHLSYSAGIFVDEMHNIHQVRNKILFGSWRLDKFPSIAYSPIFAGLQYIILSVVGIGMWQIKILPIFLSILSLFLLYKSFEEYFGGPYGIVAIILLGFNYTFAMCNRLGLFENLIIFFIFLTLFLWQRALRTERKLYFFLTGVSTILAFAAKTMAFYFVCAMVLTLLLYYVQRRKERNAFNLFLFFLLGFILTGILWYLACYLPFKADLSRLGPSWLKLALRKGIFYPLIRPNPIFARLRFLPLTLGLGFLYAFIALYKFLKAPEKIDLFEMSIFLWFLIGLSFLSVILYRPTRYYFPVLPSIVLLCAIGISRFAERKRSIELFSPKDGLFYTIFFTASVLITYYFIIPYVRRYLPHLARIVLVKHLSRGGDFLASLFFGSLFLIVLGVFDKWARGNGYRGNLKQPLRQGATYFFIATILLINFHFYLHWARKPDYSIVRTSRNIGNMLPPDSVMMGQGVMAVGIENKIRYVQAPNWFEDSRNLFNDYRVTHLFISHYAHYIEWYRRHYPLVMKYSKIIAKYRIGRKTFYLFQIDIPESMKKRACQFR